MKPLTEQDVIDIIEKYNKKAGGTVSGFTVPLHRHNGSDMIKVIMGDLDYDYRGLIFPLTNGIAQINVSGIFGQNDTLFFGGDSNTQNLSYIFGAIGYPTSYSNFYHNTDNMQILTNTNNWFLRLPNNTVLPTSPQVGDICIFNGILQVCEVAGVWTPK